MKYAKILSTIRRYSTLQYSTVVAYNSNQCTVIVMFMLPYYLCLLVHFIPYFPYFCCCFFCRCWIHHRLHKLVQPRLPLIVNSLRVTECSSSFIPLPAVVTMHTEKVGEPVWSDVGKLFNGLTYTHIYISIYICIHMHILDLLYCTCSMKLPILIRGTCFHCLPDCMPHTRRNIQFITRICYSILFAANCQFIVNMMNTNRWP